MSHWIDLVCVAILGLSFILGIWRGLIYEVLSLAGWVLAYFFAQMLAPTFAPLVPQYLSLDWDAGATVHYAVAFIVLFVVGLIASSLLAMGLKMFTQALGLKPVDRALGAAFGLLRGLLIVLVLAAAVEMTPWAEQEAWTESTLNPYLQAGVTLIEPLLPHAIRQYLPTPS